MKRHEQLDKELTQKIERIVSSGDILKSREQQTAAEKLIRQRADFRKRHGLKDV